MRALTNRDIATGTISTTDNETYSSTGTSSTWQFKNTVPDSPAPTCYVRALLSTCTDDQVAAVVNGTALIHDWIVIDNNTATLTNGTAGNSSSSGDRPSTPSSSASSGIPGGSSTGTSGATASPSTTSTSEGLELGVQLSSVALVLAIAIAVML